MTPPLPFEKSWLRPCKQKDSVPKLKVHRAAFQFLVKIVTKATFVKTICRRQDRGDPMSSSTRKRKKLRATTNPGSISPIEKRREDPFTGCPSERHKFSDVSRPTARTCGQERSSNEKPSPRQKPRNSSLEFLHLLVGQNRIYCLLKVNCGLLARLFTLTIK